MIRFILLSFLFSSFLMQSCSKETSPLGAVDNSDTMPTHSFTPNTFVSENVDTNFYNNGFIADAGSAGVYISTRLIAADAIVDDASNVTTVSFTDVLTSDTTVRDVSCQVVFPRNGQGVYRWDDITKTPDGNQYVIITIGQHVSYVSVDGETTVTLDNDKTDYITGKFSGTFQDGFGNSMEVTNGRFHGFVQER